MAEQTTSYDVILKYQAQDHASQAVEHLTHKVEHSGMAFEQAGEHVRHWGREAILMGAASAGVQLGFEGIIEKVKESNEEFNKAQRRISGIYFSMLQWDKGTSATTRASEAWKMSREQVERLEDVAAKLAVPLNEVSDTYARMSFNLGGVLRTHEKVNAVTEDATMLAVALGVGTEQANLSLTKMIQTGMAPRGEVGLALRGAGVDVQHLAKHAHTARERFEELHRAIREKVAPMAAQMATGFDASMARVRNSVDQLVRDLTTPLFNKIANDAERFAKWLHAAREDGKTNVQYYADLLVKGFEKMKDLAEAIANHWKTIATIWGSAKVMNFIMALGSGPTGTVAKALLGLGGSAGILATGAVAASAAGATVAGSHMLEAYGKGQSFKAAALGEIGIHQSMKHMFDLTNEFRANMRATNIVDPKAFAAGQELLKSKMIAEAQQRGITAESLKAFSQNLRYLTEQAKDPHVVAYYAKELATVTAMSGIISEVVKGKEKDIKPEFKKTQQNFYGDIHVVQDFKDVDPDRVFVRFKEDLERLPERPTSGRFSGAAGNFGG